MARVEEGRYGAAINLTLLSLSIVGGGLRDELDPRLHPQLGDRATHEMQSGHDHALFIIRKMTTSML
jgi:hypothetical protein